MDSEKGQEAAPQARLWRYRWHGRPHAFGSSSGFLPGAAGLLLVLFVLLFENGFLLHRGREHGGGISLLGAPDDQKHTCGYNGDEHAQCAQNVWQKLCDKWNHANSLPLPRQRLDAAGNAFEFGCRINPNRSGDEEIDHNQRGEQEVPDLYLGHLAPRALFNGMQVSLRKQLLRFLLQFRLTVKYERK